MFIPVLPTSFARGGNHQRCSEIRGLNHLNPSFLSKEEHLCPQAPSLISPWPPNLLLSLVHGKMQLLSRFPAAFPGYPMEWYLADHSTVQSVCWLQGEGNNNEITWKDLFFLFLQIWLAQWKSRSVVNKRRAEIPFTLCGN